MQIFFIIPYPDNMKKTELNITSVACTASEALRAFLRPHPQKNTSYPIKTAQNRSDTFYECEWLCTGMNAPVFQVKITV